MYLPNSAPKYAIENEKFHWKILPFNFKVGNFAGGWTPLVPKVIYRGSRDYPNILIKCVILLADLWGFTTARPNYHDTFHVSSYPIYFMFIYQNMLFTLFFRSFTAMIDNLILSPEWQNSLTACEITTHTKKRSSCFFNKRERPSVLIARFCPWTNIKTLQ